MSSSFLDNYEHVLPEILESGRESVSDDDSPNDCNMPISRIYSIKETDSSGESKREMFARTQNNRLSLVVNYNDSPH
jgi:hypothetical protein